MIFISTLICVPFPAVNLYAQAYIIWSMHEYNSSSVRRRSLSLPCCCAYWVHSGYRLPPLRSDQPWWRCWEGSSYTRLSRWPCSGLEGRGRILRPTRSPRHSGDTERPHHPPRWWFGQCTSWQSHRCTASPEEKLGTVRDSTQSTEGYATLVKHTSLLHKGLKCYCGVESCRDALLAEMC